MNFEVKKLSTYKELFVDDVESGLLRVDECEELAAKMFGALLELGSKCYVAELIRHEYTIEDLFGEEDD